MSVQRSPPSVDMQTLKTPAITHCSSDSALNISSSFMGQFDHASNITKRHKRTFYDYSKQSVSDDTDMKTMIADMKDQQDQKFEALTKAISVVINQNQSIQKSVDIMSSQYEELLLKSNSLEKENIDLKKRVSLLENQLEQYDKSSRSSTIEVRNIPIQSNENKQVLSGIVKNIGSVLSIEPPIASSEIRNIFRSKSESIVVEFTCTSRKDALLGEHKKLIKSRRESNKPLLNTADININGPPKNIFISESLTKKVRRLFYIARESVKNKKLIAAWTSFGRVYIKKEEGSAPIRIENEYDLQNIK